jgi:hypothetical protein
MGREPLPQNETGYSSDQSHQGNSNAYRQQESTKTGFVGVVSHPTILAGGQLKTMNRKQFLPDVQFAPSRQRPLDWRHSGRSHSIFSRGRRTIVNVSEPVGS